MTTAIPASSTNGVRKEIVDAISRHRHSAFGDSLMYNGGTALALACTIIVGIWSKDDPSWYPKILSGLATFVVGMERSLKFGARWRFHIGMQAAYRSLLALFDSGNAVKFALTYEAVAARESEHP